jgi:hypothetical protein
VVNHFELVIPERLVLVEGIHGDIYLPNPLVPVDKLVRAAAAMRVEIKDEHGAGACVERRTGGEDKTIECARTTCACRPAAIGLTAEFTALGLIITAHGVDT